MNDSYPCNKMFGPRDSRYKTFSFTQTRCSEAFEKGFFMQRQFIITNDESPSRSRFVIRWIECDRFHGACKFHIVIILISIKATDHDSSVVWASGNELALIVNRYLIHWNHVSGEILCIVDWIVNSVPLMIKQMNSTPMCSDAKKLCQTKQIDLYCGCFYTLLCLFTLECTAIQLTASLLRIRFKSLDIRTYFNFGSISSSSELSFSGV